MCFITGFFKEPIFLVNNIQSNIGNRTAKRSNKEHRINMIFIYVIIVLIFAATAYFLKKVSLSGAVAGAIISFVILWNNWVNFLLFGLFFVLGSMATKWQFERKRQLNVLQENEGVRTWVHASANGGIPAFYSLLALLFPESASLTYAATAAIAAALSDTLSSELGNIYGHYYVNILNFKKGNRGDDGVISLEGTLFGVLGSLLIAGLFGTLRSNYSIILPITIAGFAGNLMDSYLGATLQRKGWINNHFVNFLNTAFAAFLVVL